MCLRTIIGACNSICAVITYFSVFKVATVTSAPVEVMKFLCAHLQLH